MKNLKNTLFGALLGLSLFPSTSNAALIQIDETDFTGSATVIDFNAITTAEAITNQFSGSGATYSGGLFGMTNLGDTILFNGSTIASNWIYGGPGLQGTSWTASFDALYTMVGFFSESNSQDSVTIEAFAGATSLGSINFLNPNDTEVDFLGISESAGFDRIVVTTDTNQNGFFAMDDFRFEGSVGQAPVPAPATLALFGLALAGLGMSRRQKA